MRKFAPIYCFLLGICLFLGLASIKSQAAPPVPNNAVPSSTSAQTEKATYTLRNVTLGMSPQEVLKSAGEPTFKAKKGNSWNYRHKPGAPEGISDPQITFKNGHVSMVIGSQMEHEGQVILKRTDTQQKITSVLGQPAKIEKGAAKGLEVLSYPNLHLQIVTQNGKLMVMCQNVKF